MDKKNKTLQELITQGASLGRNMKIIRNIYILLFILSVIVFMLFLSLPTHFAAILSNTPENGLGSILLQHVLRFFTGSPMTVSSGYTFNVLILAGIFSQMIFLGAMTYIFHSITKVFELISEGLSPFTTQIASYWKNCSKLLGALGMVYLLSVCNLNFIYYELAGSFFFALSLIFEYGGGLQREADETL